MPAEIDTPHVTPAITLDFMKLSGGDELSFSPSDIILFVGSNNAGKSRLLRDLYGKVNHSPYQSIIIENAKFLQKGSSNDLAIFLSRNFRQKDNNGHIQILGYRVNFSKAGACSDWQNYSYSQSLTTMTPIFCTYLATTTRLTDCATTDAGDYLNQGPQHPIHFLMLQPKVEQRISGYFRRAFGVDLIPHKMAGTKAPLMIGSKPNLLPDETYQDDTYWARLTDNCSRLDDQGDGMKSFASTILFTLVPTTASMLIVDEPEAFLHPPQARILGELIVKEKPMASQLFIATHSIDILQGVLSADPDHLRIIKLSRDGNANRAKELNKNKISDISRDPLMRYSSVLSGLFHSRVIICESDSDCQFYSSILGLNSVHGAFAPDVLFIHASGKDRMAAMAAALREMDVPVDVIADIDIISDDVALTKLAKSLGSDDQNIGALARSICADIGSSRPENNAEETKQRIQSILDELPEAEIFPADARKRIRELLTKSSPWAAIKNAGATALPKGQATRNFKELTTLCAKVGLWIVQVGELEGFCSSVGGHGSKWVQEVSKLDIEKAHELQAARDFIKTIWESRAGLIE